MTSWDDVTKWLFPQPLGPSSPRSDPDPDDVRFTEEGVPAEWTWLYESENWSSADWIRFKILYNTDYGKKWIDYAYAARRDREYFERHNLDRSDVHDPTRLYTVRALGGLNWTPDVMSLARLYR